MIVPSGLGRAWAWLRLPGPIDVLARDAPRIGQLESEVSRADRIERHDQAPDRAEREVAAGRESEARTADCRSLNVVGRFGIDERVVPIEPVPTVVRSRSAVCFANCSGVREAGAVGPAVRSISSRDGCSSAQLFSESRAMRSLAAAVVRMWFGGVRPRAPSRR